MSSRAAAGERAGPERVQSLIPHLSLAERYALGKRLRAQCPRGSHASWKASPGRPDAVRLVLQGDQGRDERKAAMADLDAQRLDTLKALQAQTDAVMSRVDALSREVMDRVDATSRTTVGEIAARADHVVDRVFLRAAQLGLAFAVLLLVAALLVARALGVRLRRSPGA